MTRCSPLMSMSRNLPCRPTPVTSSAVQRRQRRVERLDRVDRGDVGPRDRPADRPLAQERGQRLDLRQLRHGIEDRTCASDPGGLPERTSGWPSGPRPSGPAVRLGGAPVIAHRCPQHVTSTVTRSTCLFERRASDDAVGPRCPVQSGQAAHGRGEAAPAVHPRGGRRCLEGQPHRPGSGKVTIRRRPAGEDSTSEQAADEPVDSAAVDSAAADEAHAEPADEPAEVDAEDATDQG